MNRNYSTKNKSSKLNKVAEFKRIHQDLVRIAQSITDSEGNQSIDMYVTEDGQLNMPNLLAVARHGLWGNPSLEWLNIVSIRTVTRPEKTEIIGAWNEKSMTLFDYFLFVHSNAYIPETVMGPQLAHQTGMFMRIVDGVIVGIVTVDYINYSNTVELYPYVLTDTIEALSPQIRMAPGAQLMHAKSLWDMNSKSTIEVPVFIIRSPANLQTYESVFKSIQVMDLDGLCQTWTLAVGALLINVLRSTVSDNVIPAFIQTFQRDFNITEGIESHLTIFKFLLRILTEYAIRENITIRKTMVRRTSDGDTQMIDRDTGEVAVRYRTQVERPKLFARNQYNRYTRYRRKSLERLRRIRKREGGYPLRRESEARPFKKTKTNEE